MADELSEQVLAAEQDERRRIALFLHDGPVQALSGIALMLDAALEFLREDESVEVTPLNVRLRKTILDQTSRLKASRVRKRNDS